MRSIARASTVTLAALALAGAARSTAGPRDARAAAPVRVRVAAVAAATNPCSLVSADQASRIVGARVLSSREAPLGPTCIYAFRRKASDVTIVIESLTLKRAIGTLRRPSKFLLRGRLSYCGTLGHQVLFTSLPRGKVLSVSAPCATARRFAQQALIHLRVG